MLAAIVPVCRSSLEMGRRAGAMALARRSCRITQLLWQIGEFGKETLQESELHVGIRNQSDETAGVLCQRSGMNGLEIRSTCSDGGLDLHFECIKCCLECLGLSLCLQQFLKCRMEVCIVASAVRSASVSMIPRGTALCVASFRAVLKSVVNAVRSLPAALSALTLSRMSLAVSPICLYNAFSV